MKDFINSLCSACRALYSERMAELGRAKSKAKSAASKRNGRKGGRPKKTT